MKRQFMPFPRARVRATAARRSIACRPPAARGSPGISSAPPGPSSTADSIPPHRDRASSASTSRAGASFGERCVLREGAGTLWLREIITLRDAPFCEQRAGMRRLAHRHRPLRILVDRTGMGEAVVEQYQDDHGRLRIEGVLLTSARRLDVATHLREAVEDRRLRAAVSS